MDERTFADAFPKFLWKPSREVARTAVDALDGDKGSVIPGLPSQTQYAAVPVHAATAAAAAIEEPASGTAAGTAQRADAGQRRIQPSTGSASALHSEQMVRYQPTAVSNSIRCSSVKKAPQCYPSRLRPRAGALQLVHRLDQRALGRAPPRVVGAAGHQRVALVVADTRDRAPERRLPAPLVLAANQRADAKDRDRPHPGWQKCCDVKGFTELAQPGGQCRMALQATNQQQRLVTTVWVTPAVDASGIFLAPRRGKRCDAAHGCDCTASSRAARTPRSRAGSRFAGLG